MTSCAGHVDPPKRRLSIRWSLVSRNVVNVSSLDPRVSNDFQRQFQLMWITLIQRVVLLGILFLKPKADDSLRAADERRIQNWG